MDCDLRPKLKRLRDRARRAFLNSDIASFWAGSSPCLLDKRPAALDGWMKLDTICFSVIFPALRTMNASVGALRFKRPKLSFFGVGPRRFATHS